VDIAMPMYLRPLQGVKWHKPMRENLEERQQLRVLMHEGKVEAEEEEQEGMEYMVDLIFLTDDKQQNERVQMGEAIKDLFFIYFTDLYLSWRLISWILMMGTQRLWLNCAGERGRKRGGERKVIRGSYNCCFT